MKVDTIVTLEDNLKYVLLDETIQNEKKYFLATSILEDGSYSTDSMIFSETLSEGESYLKEERDLEKLRYLLSVFTTSLIQEEE